MKLLLLSVDAGNEAHALRAAAEAWEHRVEVAWIGSKRRMLDELATADAADALVVCAHGDPEGFLMPDVSAELHVDDHDAHLTPADLRSAARLPPLIVSTACLTGSEAFANAAFDAGARDYLAPPGYPDGAATLMTVLGLLHELRIDDASVAGALRVASRPTGCADVLRSFRPL